MVSWQSNLFKIIKNKIKNLIVEIENQITKLTPREHLRIKFDFSLNVIKAIIPFARAIALGATLPSPPI